MNANEILGKQKEQWWVDKPLTPKDVRIPAREQFRICQDFAPALWEKFNRKVYSGVDKYHDPRFVSAFCTNVMWHLCEEIHTHGQATGQVPEVQRAATIQKAVLASELYKHGMPLFFVSKPLLDAALRTRLPDVINWDTLALPYEAAAFVLPVNSVSTPVGGKTGFVGYARLRQQRYLLEPIHVSVEIPTNGWLAISFDTEDAIEGYRLVFDPEYRTAVDDNVHYKASFDAYDGFDTVNIPPETFREYTGEMTKLVFNLLLLMQEKPELTTSGRHIGRVKKSGRELWSPNVIGRDYVIHREYQGGTHASPKWHWRCGHWRTQHIGRRICKCGHIPAAHERGGPCKMNGCFDKCTGWIYEDSYRKHIAPMLVNGSQLEGKDAES